MNKRKPLGLALLLTPLVALTACTEIPASKQTLKKHTIVYKVSHSTTGASIDIEYGYQTKKGKEYKYTDGTSRRTWREKRTTAKQRITYAGLDVTSEDTGDRITCEIIFDGKRLVRKTDTYTVSC